MAVSIRQNAANPSIFTKQSRLSSIARPNFVSRSERGGIIHLAQTAYPPFAGGVADIRGFGGWDLV